MPCGLFPPRGPRERQLLRLRRCGLRGLRTSCADWGGVLLGRPESPGGGLSGTSSSSPSSVMGERETSSPPTPPQSLPARAPPPGPPVLGRLGWDEITWTKAFSVMLGTETGLHLLPVLNMFPLHRLPPQPSWMGCLCGTLLVGCYPRSPGSHRTAVTTERPPGCFSA